MPGKVQPDVLICGPEEFCEEAALEFRKRRADLAISTADEMDEIAGAAGNVLACVILLDDRLVTLEAASRKKWKQCLRETIVFLSARTRVVWIGRKQDQEVLSGSQSAGQVDFVPRGPFCISAAVRMVERRLLTMERKRILLKPNADADSWRDARLKNLGFAEIFRHELNNPLTGILGNAELLLLDARRGKFLLPAESLKRLETISSLAVRLRETVRELGDRWAETGEAKSGCTQVSAREEEDLPPAAHG